MRVDIKRKVLILIGFVMFLGLLVFLFSCGKVRISPTALDVEKLETSEIKITYTRDKIKEKIKINEPYETNGILEFKNIQDFLSFYYDKETQVLELDFEENKEISLQEFKVQVLNGSDEEIGIINFEIIPNKDYLNDYITELTAKLVAVKVPKTGMVKDIENLDPKELPVHKKYITESYNKKCEELLKEAIKIMEDKGATQQVINAKEEELKKLVNDFGHNITTGEKLREQEVGKKYLSIALFFGVLGVSLIILLVFFIVKNKRKTATKEGKENIKDEK